MRLVALIFASLLLPATAQAAVVDVIGTDGAVRSVDLEPLLAAPDVRDRAYTLRSEDGPRRETVTGASLAAVLDVAEARVDAFRHAEVQAPGGAVLFSREQALESSGAPPVFTAGGDGGRLLRPSAGRDDLNADDVLIAERFTVRLRQRVRPAVRVEVSDPRPEVGQRVTFTASVTGVGAGERTTISWLIGSSSERGQMVAHRFRKEGNVRVLATVTTPGDDVGASSVVSVKVGAKEEPEPEPERRPEADSAPAGGGGGSSSGGGSPAAAPAKPSRSPKHEPARRPDTRPLPGEVEGEVLEVMEPEVAPVAAQRAISAAPRADAGTGFGLPAEAWTGIGLGAALLAGFGFERRRSRPGEVA